MWKKEREQRVFQNLRSWKNRFVQEEKREEKEQEKERIGGASGGKSRNGLCRLPGDGREQRTDADAGKTAESVAGGTERGNRKLKEKEKTWNSYVQKLEEKEVPVLERLRQALEQYGQLQSHLKEAQRLEIHRQQAADSYRKADLSYRQHTNVMKLCIRNILPDRQGFLLPGYRTIIPVRYVVPSIIRLRRSRFRESEPGTGGKRERTPKSGGKIPGKTEDRSISSQKTSISRK